MFLHIILPLILTIYGATNAQSQERTAGGKPAGVYKSNFVVSIEFKNKFLCSGTLIGPHYVLTIASAFDNINYANFLSTVKPPTQTPILVRAGSRRLYQDGITKKVEKITLHPLYRGRASNFNVCVLKLESDFTLSATIDYARLPHLKEEVPSSAIGHIAGWGSPRGLVQELFEVELKVQPLCFLANHANFCAKNILTLEDQGVCQDDVGSAFVVSQVAHGILTTVSSINCDTFLTPSVFLKISTVINFIHSAIDARP